jgi:hypothetical protein
VGDQDEQPRRPRRRALVSPVILGVLIPLNFAAGGYAHTWQRIGAVFLLLFFVVTTARWFHDYRRYNAHIAAGGRPDPSELPEAPPRV